MKNTILDLNNYLFEQIERLSDDYATEEELDQVIKRSDAIVKVSTQIIENGNLIFKTMKHMDDYGYGQNRALPALLDLKGED